MMHVKHSTLALAVAGAGLLGALGVGGPAWPGAVPQPEGEPAALRRAVHAATDDTEFVQMAAEHHGSGIEMARFAADHAERSGVRSIAERMRDQHEREQREMETMALEAGAPAHKVEPSMKERSSRMVEELHTSAGPDIDAVFLRNMIVHHEDGVAMIQASQPNVRDGQLRRRAEEMLDRQRKEIEEMRRMQEELPGRTADVDR